MKKLSETFLEFIEPALEVLGNPLPMTEDHDAACALGCNASAGNGIVALIDSLVA